MIAYRKIPKKVNKVKKANKAVVSRFRDQVRVWSRKEVFVRVRAEMF